MEIEDLTAEEEEEEAFQEEEDVFYPPPPPDQGSNLRVPTPPSPISEEVFGEMISPSLIAVKKGKERMEKHVLHFLARMVEPTFRFVQYLMAETNMEISEFVVLSPETTLQSIRSAYDLVKNIFDDVFTHFHEKRVPLPSEQVIPSMERKEETEGEEGFRKPTRPTESMTTMESEIFSLLKSSIRSQARSSVWEVVHDSLTSAIGGTIVGSPQTVREYMGMNLWDRLDRVLNVAIQNQSLPKVLTLTPLVEIYLGESEERLSNIIRKKVDRRTFFTNNRCSVLVARIVAKRILQRNYELKRIAGRGNYRPESSQLRFKREIVKVYFEAAECLKSVQLTPQYRKYRPRDLRRLGDQ